MILVCRVPIVQTLPNWTFSPAYWIDREPTRALKSSRCLTPDLRGRQDLHVTPEVSCVNLSGLVPIGGELSSPQIHSHLTLIECMTETLEF